MRRLKRTAIGFLIPLTLVGCSSKGPKTASSLSDSFTRKTATEGEFTLIRSDYAPSEITRLCDASIQEATAKVNKIAALPKANRTVDNTLLAFEEAFADFNDQTNPLAFMGDVSPERALRDEANACKEKAAQFGVEILTRRDIYIPLKAAKGRNADEKRLHFRTIEAFELSGMKLDDTKLAALKKILTKLNENQTKFEANLGNDVSTVELTKEELEGTPEDLRKRLKVAPSGNFLVTTKSTDYTDVIDNAKSGEARRKILFGFLNRGTPENTRLLQETIQLRADAARLLGYATWTDYQSVTRMAKNKKSILSFMNGLKAKLAKKNRADLDQFLTYLKKEDPTKTKIEEWDLRYSMNQLKKTDFNVDSEKVREYFPADVVVPALFDVYSRLLGVTYKEVPHAQVWSPDVKLYEIREKSDNHRIGYFYADFVPREGKYGHAAAFSLINGRVIGNGYKEPVSSIVANFAPPTPEKPSLLLHDEVETLFHEFGHIMHQTLTKARYASLAGSSTARDFVEAPSQMLENWVWTPEILKMISGHYTDHSQKLPDDLIKQMIAAKKVGEGYFYTRQLLFGFFDLSIHSDAFKNDVTKTYLDLFSNLIGVQPMEGGHFPQTFGHMMGGYSAGYYGYLWSKVYAQDMFTVFKKEGILSAEPGGRYRRTILERGDMKDANVNLKDFLGRKPSQEAFFKYLGL